MRIYEIINESTIKLSNDVVVYKNPIRRQVDNLFREVNISANKFYKERDKIFYDADTRLKGITASGNIYVWNPWLGSHMIVAEWLEAEGYIPSANIDEDILFFLKKKNNEIIPLNSIEEPMKGKSIGEKVVIKWVNKLNAINEDEEKEEKLELPDIEIGDEVKVGRFKNRKATIKGFEKDKHNQPEIVTNKGKHKLFKPRISKLEDEKTKKNESLDK